MMNNKLLLITLLFTACAIDSVFGHSYITSPVSRTNQVVSNAGCRGPACMGPCDAPASAARTPIRINRGDLITAKWPRNNHAAGFIRWAWAPTAQSDSHAAFDANVQLYSCHETGKVAGGACAPSSTSDPNGGDANPGDGSRGACTRDLTVPKHLPNGRWTLQWAWFGGAFNLGDYYSCIDYEIVGGAEGSQDAAQFDGGDFANPTATGPTGKCKFFNTRKLRTCLTEPCFVGEMPGQNTGRPASFDALPSSSATPVPTPATPPPATPTPATPPPATPTPATPAPTTATPAPSASATAAPGTCAPAVVTVTVTVTATAPAVTASPAPSASASATAAPFPSASATAAPSQSATPIPNTPSDDFSVTYAVGEKWSNGMTGTVRATANKNLKGWSVDVHMPATLEMTSVWNAQLLKNTVSGNTRTVTLGNPSWQPNLSTGNVVSIGFNAKFPAGRVPVVAAEGFSYQGASSIDQADEASAQESSQNAAEKNASGNGSNVASIVGISVGSVCAAALLAVGAVAAIRKRRQAALSPPRSEEIQFAQTI